MAETWIPVDEALVRERLADMEWDIFTTGALANGYSNVIGNCIRSVVGRVRGCVAASGKWSLGPVGTVPPELESAAMHVLRREIASRVPQSGIVFDKIREGALTDALEQLAMIRDGKGYITPPETVEGTGTAVDSGCWGSAWQVDFTALN